MKALTHKLRLLALRGLLTHPPVSGPVGTSLKQVQNTLPSMLKKQASHVLHCIGQPEILVPLLVLRAGLKDPTDLIQALLPNLVAQLAPNPPILLDFPVRAFYTKEAFFQFSPPCRAMISDVAGVEIERANGQRHALDMGSGSRRKWALKDGFVLAAEDHNPLRMQEAHPDKSGNTLSLGGKSVSLWQNSLNEALSLIQQTLPGFYAALPHALHRIVPVGYEPEMHLSASYREAPGTVYMTLHPNPLTLAEAIIHEVQHGKLNTLSWFDAVLKNGMTEWTSSPVRPDLRPLWGVFLAVHAFVPVSILHRKLMDQSHPLALTTHFQTRRQEVWEGNTNGLHVVREKGQLTGMGEKVLSGLESLHAQSRDNPDPTSHPKDRFLLPPG